MQKQQYIPGLDGVRALAVIAVVWHHAHPGLRSMSLTEKGFLGVDVFFVLSGFLITTLLLNERDVKGSISLKNFFIRRSIRIFPLYYAVLTLLVGYFALLPASEQKLGFFREAWFHATYTSNWVRLDSLMSISWSLSTEEQFYLIWPPLLVCMGLRALPLLGAFLLLNQLVNFGWLDEALHRFGMPYGSLPILEATFTPIILGVFLSFMLRSPQLRQLAERGSARLGLAFALALMLLAASIDGDIRGWPRLVFQLAATWMLCGIVLHPTRRFVRVLEWRPLAYVGVVSYGVYLLHKLSLSAVFRLAPGLKGEGSIALFVFCLAGTLLLASISYRFFERPLLRLNRLFRS